jgi:two-component system, cell cycle sensor histidine kinase and response regulator CckA
MANSVTRAAGSAQILVVDDIPANLRLLTGILTLHGYTVRPASSGSLALRSVAVQAPDLILLDVKMPDIDGYEVCRRLKSDESSGKIPVIFISTLDDAADKVKGFELGAVDYITKPFQSAEVLARVNTHLTLRSMQQQLEAQNSRLQQEISERIRTEEALRNSEERIRLLIERSPLGVAILQNGAVVYRNPALTKFIGGNGSDQIIGRPLTDFIEAGDRDVVLRAQEDIMAGKTLLNSIEVGGLRDDGKQFDMTLWHTRIDLPEGPATLVFAADTSEDKILRAQLFQAQKMEAVATLSSGIAHEFNNLLTIVTGYTGLILADKTNANADYQDLTKIIDACDRGADLVKRLTTFGRKTKANLAPVDINKEIEHIKELLCRTIPRMIDIELTLAEDLGTVDADAGQLGQVLVNIALNARDAMPGGGNLTFETRNVCLNREHCERIVGANPGDYVRLSISDTGHGMDKDVVDRIFEPFYTTRGLAERSGLGLAVAYSIVDSHGGYITCDSKVGEGTTFEIYFPVTDLKEAGKEKPGHAPPRGGSGAILLVDDEENVRELAGRILGREGYKVLTAPDGEHAVSLYKEERGSISLVILDLIMPGMGGKQCLAKLFEIDPRVKVLICSGVILDDQNKEFLETCSRGWLTKPYRREQLLEAVRKALKTDCNPTFSDCPIDAATRWTLPGRR